MPSGEVVEDDEVVVDDGESLPTEEVAEVDEDNAEDNENDNTQKRQRTAPRVPAFHSI